MRNSIYNGITRKPINKAAARGLVGVGYKDKGNHIEPLVLATPMCELKSRGAKKRQRIRSIEETEKRLKLADPTTYPRPMSLARARWLEARGLNPYIVVASTSGQKRFACLPCGPTP